MIPPRRVHHVANLVGLGADRRKVLDDRGAPARLTDPRVTRIRLELRTDETPGESLKGYIAKGPLVGKRGGKNPPGRNGGAGPMLEVG